jgi:hypothetical protein
MTDDPGNEIRERFRATSLPPAPVRLRERLAAVPSSPTATMTSRFGRARLIVALAAAIVVGSIGLVVNGGLTEPSLSPDGGPWGPLAVANLMGAEAALTHGELLFTDECAFLLQGDGIRALLVWPAARTTWNADTQTVSLRHLQTLDSVTLREGVALALGGGGSSVHEDGLSGDAWAARFDWVAPPASECLTDERWVVSDALEPVAEATPEPAYNFVCEEAEPPAFTCAEIVDMLSNRVLPDMRNNGPIVEIEVSRACDQPCPPEPRGIDARVTFSSGLVVLVQLDRESWHVMPESGETDLPTEPPPDREPAVVCAEAEPPALTCAAIRDEVLAALGQNHPPVERIEVIDTCFGGQIPICERSNMVDVHLERLTIPLVLRDGPDGPIAAVRGETTERSFGPVYPDAPDESLPRGPWIWKATLSGERRTLSIEFFGWTDDPSMDPCTSEFEPRVEFSGLNLHVQVVRTPRQRDPAEPSPTPAPPGTIWACDVTGYHHVYHLALPEPFLHGDILDLTTDEFIIHTEL